MGALSAQAPASGGLTGRVINGTTNRPVPNVAVQYLLLQQGMEPVAAATTDREGRFEFEKREGSGDSPVLLRVEYQGAAYSQTVMSPQNQSGNLEVRVFDAGREPGLFAVQEQAIFLRPSGDTLTVLEQLYLQNRSAPPRTYVNPEGTYRFHLPGKPRDGVQITVTGPGGMPIQQTPMPQATNDSFAINYPIRPGETEVRLQYALDYREPFEFSKLLDLPAERTHIITPGKEVQVSGEALLPAGSDPATGYTGYELTPKDKQIRLQVSGQAPARVAEESAQASEGSGQLAPIPDPVSRQRWLILAVASLVLLGGFVYHYTR